MLVIQIAMGIVLGFLILKHWDKAVAFGGCLLMLAIGLAVLAIIVSLCVTYWKKVEPILIILAFFTGYVIALTIGILIVQKYVPATEQEASKMVNAVFIVTGLAFLIVTSLLDKNLLTEPIYIVTVCISFLIVLVLGVISIYNPLKAINKRKAAEQPTPTTIIQEEK